MPRLLSSPSLGEWKSAGETLPKGTRGAVYVEFLIAFLPVFCFFLALVQFCLLQVVNLIVKHAAEQTVRAAIVIIHDDPQYYGGAPVGMVSGMRKSEIERAAKYLLEETGGDVNVILNGSYGRDEMVTVKVELNFPCTVPFGRLLVCDGAPSTAQGVYAEHDGSKWIAGGKEYRMLHGQATLPNQGMDYEY